MTAPKLLDRVRERLRMKHYSLRTEEAYPFWIRRFFRSSGKRHPRDTSGPEVERFLSHLATERRLRRRTRRSRRCCSSIGRSWA